MKIILGEIMETVEYKVIKLTDAKNWKNTKVIHTRGDITFGDTVSIWSTAQRLVDKTGSPCEVRWNYAGSYQGFYREFNNV